MKNILTFAVIAGALAIVATPSQAAKDCSGEMKRVDALMPADQSAGKAAMARAELKIAADKAAKKDEQGCMMHVGNAEKALK